MNLDSEPSVDTLLASLREIPSPALVDPGIRLRLQSRLAVSLVGLAPAATLGSAPLKVAATSKGIVVAWLAPVFVAGALSGIAADRWYRAQQVVPSVATPSVEAPVAMVAAPPAIETARVEELERVRDEPALAPAVNSPLASAEPADSMAAERQLLDAARTALARGEPGEGVTALEKHVKRFPKGTLAEEREALYVRILAAMGNDAAAQARAASFQRRFPNSIFTPVVERALASISRRNSDAEPKL